MSLREEMLASARRARPRLGDAAGKVVAFLGSRAGPNGGYRGRGEAEDLYYTVFALEGLLALDAAPPRAASEYLRGFGAGAALDFVHLTCLARCWAALPDAKPSRQTLDGMRARLDRFRAGDGGFHTEPRAARSSAYGCFLAVGACEDLGVPLPEAARFAAILETFRTPDAGYGNEAGQTAGLTPITAGMYSLRQTLGAPADPRMEAWLRARLQPEGGCAAAAGLPLPDLLSTATTLYAFRRAGRPLDAERAACLRFLDQVWSEAEGGFCGHAFDRTVDCEYTWYGLLALGCLSA